MIKKIKYHSPLSFTTISLLLLVVWQWETALSTGTSDCSCYLFHTTAKNWKDSNQYCNGGTLVSMETEEEYQFINKTIQNIDVRNNEWYIGLKTTYPGNKGYWHWISGHSLTIADKWGESQPSGNGDCVKMIKDYNKKRGSFDDVKCNGYYMFICEYKTVQTCPSNTKKWCPPSNRLTTTTNEYITTTTSLPTTKKTTTAPIRASSSTTTTTQRKDSSRPTTDKKSTSIISSSTENQRQTTSFIQTTKPEAANANVSSTFDNESTTGATQKIGVTHNPQSKSSGSSQFPLVIVTVSLGIVLAVSVCLLFFVCYWKRRNYRGGKNEKPKSKTTSLPPDAIEETSNNQGFQDGGSAEGVQLFHQSNGESYVAYAVIHNNLSQQNQGPSASNNEPSYASIEDEKMIKRSSRKKGQNAAMPPVTINAENSGNSVGGGKSTTETLYASIGKSKKNNIKKESQGPSNQQVVYASVDKSKKLSKARAEDVVYAEVGNKENKEKQQLYQVTYAELADFNQSPTEEAVKPAPYQPAEYAVIIGQKQTC